MMQHNTIKSVSSLGRSDADNARDGDMGPLEQPSVLRSEASSIKQVKSPKGRHLAAQSVSILQREQHESTAGPSGVHTERKSSADFSSSSNDFDDSESEGELVNASEAGEDPPPSVLDEWDLCNDSMETGSSESVREQEEARSDPALSVSEVLDFPDSSSDDSDSNESEGEPVNASKAGNDPEPSESDDSDDDDIVQNDTAQTNDDGGDEEGSPPPDPAVLEARRKNLIERVGKKQALKIASLNIHGKQDANKKSKFKKLATLMRKERIAIMAIQETRMDTEYTDRINRENPSLHVENNGQYTSKEGVGFVINKKMINVSSVKWEHSVIIPNRASRLKVQWNQDNEFDIITVHAPNAVNAKIEFIKELKRKLDELGDVEDPIMLGDWNFVEEALDRSPEHEDDNRLKAAFRNLKLKYKLVDGWRIHHPEEHDFSYTQTATNSLARIDRCYVNREVYNYALNWTITSSAEISDHKVITIDLIRKGLPFIGKGLTKFPLDILEYPPFMKECAVLIYKAQLKIEGSEAPQKEWKELQTDLMSLARTKTKDRLKELDVKCKDVEKKRIAELVNLNVEIHDAVERRAKIIALDRELSVLKKQRLTAMHKTTRARFDLEGEKCNRYWFRSQKQRSGPEPLMALFDKNNVLTTKTEDMANIASQYHAELQAPQQWSNERAQATEQLLSQVDVKLDAKERELMDKPFSLDEIEIALSQTQNGKCPGSTGIQYEVWKFWNRDLGGKIKEPKNEYEVALKNMCVMNMIETVFNDMKANGITEEYFTKGVMCLLYKKKDKRRIENYRPITLLNTDYKLFTKVISKRLALVADTLIHENQAGFVPGRSLFDSTKLSKTMIEMCETMEINGCIVSLDQEKAYDKIAHDYLWKVLEHMNFSPEFIKMIQELYKNAQTSIVVNGVSKAAIDILRGVRQGDPMSCLLYNLAIEPLACALRKSDLQGFKVKGIRDKVLASLFADDTLVYLQATDSLDELRRVIKLFCTASTAKFNMEKTEYLPIGTEEFRKNMIEHRKLGQAPGNEIEPNVRIVKDQESMRTLGAWIGNKTSTNPQWESILDRQKRIMEVWSGVHPSFRGKELVLKALVQSIALFLATVNGMPQDTEKAMTTQMRKFLWNGNRGDMRWEEVIMSKSVGGLDMPDIKSRNEAIQIMWLKRFLAPEAKRPRWAFVADMLIFHSLPQKPLVEPEARSDWILQTWNEHGTRNSAIPQHLRLMLNVGRKYNVGFDALKVGMTTKRKMPIWNHIAVSNNYYWNKRGGKCLRKIHKVKTVGDLDDLVRFPTIEQGCYNPMRCRAQAEMLLGLIPEKFSTVISSPKNDNLDHTKHRIEKYLSMSADGPAVRFDPNVTTIGDPNAHIRIFGSSRTYKKRKARGLRVQREPAYRDILDQPAQKMVAFTGAIGRKGKAGVGIWTELDEEWNEAFKVPEGPQLEPRAHILAMIAAVLKAQGKELLVKTSSLPTAEGVLKSLHAWEDKAWDGVKHVAEWKLLLALLRQRGSITEFEWSPEEDEDPGKTAAKALAVTGSEKPNGSWKPNYAVPDNWVLEGARLSAMTQKLAYSLLLKERACEPGNATGVTHRNMQDSVKEVARISVEKPMPITIWKMMRKHPIERKKSDFLWKLMHQRIKCGEFFSRIPTMQERQFCSCGQIETPDHMLWRCATLKPLWDHVKGKWSDHFTSTWNEPTLGILRGLGAVKLGNGVTTNIATSYVYKVFMIESVWAIWRLRNRRVFDDKEVTGPELINLWTELVKARIENDYGKVKLSKYRDRKKVLEQFNTTWIKTKFSEIEELEVIVTI